MGNKIFKSLDEQIKILREKGLVIDDEKFAKEVLLRENYFFLNGYRHLFMKSKDKSRYIEGTKFEELYSLFLFDRTLRNILFKNILIVENNIKSIISYQLSKKYGYREKEYLKASNFNTSSNIKFLLGSLFSIFVIYSSNASTLEYLLSSIYEQAAVPTPIYSF